jgi:branched-chain amino acid transport system ATP-binding protein
VNIPGPAERVAGADTREASASPVVRAAAAATALVAGPGWAAALGAPAAWRRYLSFPADLEPWAVVFLVLAGFGAAFAAWRMPRRERVKVAGQLTIPEGLGPALILILLSFVAVATGDPKLAATVMPAVVVLAGWFAGHAARSAVAACASNNSSAAAGLVVAGGLIGLVFAGHLALVAKGSGLIRATGWSVAYLILAAINLVRASLAARAGSVSPSAPLAPRSATEREPRGSGDEVFVLDGIVVSFGPSDVLRGVDLSVAAGELVALVGGNGAGKSTLMRVAAGLVVPDAGRVTIGKDDVTTLLVEERAAAGLGFVSGARPVFPDLTVTENLRVAAFRSHLTTRAFQEATTHILDVMPALARRARAKAGVLSGGEQRLLAVAQTLYRRPLVLLADELSLGLDAQARVAVIDLLRVLADEGVAVIAVDHDLVSLLPKCNRAALLSGGRVTIEERPERLLLRRSNLLPATFLAKAGR